MRYPAALVVLVAVGLGVQPHPGAAPRADKRDLEGVWTYATLTPLERPRELADKAFFTEAEAAAYEKNILTIQNRDRRDGEGPDGRGSDGRTDLDRAYNQVWWEYGARVVSTRRTSLIIDPPDGQIPPLTPDGQKRAEDRRGLWTADGQYEGGSRGRSFDSWLDRPLQERCLAWTTAGPPMIPGAYNNNVQIVQSPESVAIVNEMIHDQRVVPLDGRPHAGDSLRLWMGSSRGRWDGDTLVVETANFRPGVFRSASEQLRLVERFTRADAHTLMYEFTVTDPLTWTRPWTAQVPMMKSDARIFEYACHEGNYSLPNILAGARKAEKSLD